MNDLKRKLKAIDKKHSKGVGICDGALAEAGAGRMSWVYMRYLEREKSFKVWEEEVK